MAGDPAARGSAFRLALTDRALALMARRDLRRWALRRLWSASSLDPDAPCTCWNVSGSKSRQLLRIIEHTDAVHWFIAALAAQARDMKWEVMQLDPPRRASRFFRHGDGLCSVHPDAFGILKSGGETLPFFLGWER